MDRSKRDHDCSPYALHSLLLRHGCALPPHGRLLEACSRPLHWESVLREQDGGATPTQGLEMCLLQSTSLSQLSLRLHLRVHVSGTAATDCRSRFPVKRLIMRHRRTGSDYRWCHLGHRDARSHRGVHKGFSTVYAEVNKKCLRDSKFSRLMLI